MRLGVNLGYWGFGLTSADQLALALEAEAAGFDSLWTAEAYGSDAATPLAWFAAQTERIKLGAAILQMPGRSPAMTAMTAVTLDHLSNGRFLLGIGTSSGSSSRARAITSRSCARRSRGSGSSTRARRTRCRCRTGPARH